MMGDEREKPRNGQEMPCKLYWELALGYGGDEKMLKN